MAKERIKRKPFTPDKSVNEDVKSYSDLIAEKMNKKGEAAKDDIDAMLLKYEAVFSSPNGKDVLKDILNNICAIFTPAVVPNDILLTAQNDGRRMAGLMILRKVQAAKRRDSIDVINL